MPWNGKEVWVYPKHLLDKPVDINEMIKKSPEEAEGMQISLTYKDKWRWYMHWKETETSKYHILHSKQKKKMQWMKRAIMSLLHLRQLRTMTISRKAWLI